MKFLVVALSAVDIWLGGRCFLNLVGILQTSKYATSTTAIFAVLFLGFAAGSLYFAFLDGNVKLALWLAAGPWALAMVVLFLQLVMGDPQ